LELTRAYDLHSLIFEKEKTAIKYVQNCESRDKKSVLSATSEDLYIAASAINASSENRRFHEYHVENKAKNGCNKEAVNS
jgi:hypothetical protein